MQELNKQAYFVKEHIGVFKAANNYDVLDPQSSECLLECREPNLSLLTKVFRFTDYKHFTPFDFYISNLTGQTLLRAKKSLTFFKIEVDVLDSEGTIIGYLRRPIISLKPRLDVLDTSGNRIGRFQGSFTGWDFTFTYQDQEVAHVSKQWAGIGKELFTTADNYVLSFVESLEADHPARAMAFASVFCIDMLYKE